MERVVEVVRPHRRAPPPSRRRVDHLAVLEVALGHHVDEAAALLRERRHRVAQRADEVARAVVRDGVHRVEPERVHPEVPHPLERRLQHEGAHRAGAGAVVVDAVAPGGLVPLGEVRPPHREVVPLRPEVVVDDVQAHREAEPVRLVDEALQRLRPTVSFVHGVQLRPVVAPVAPPRERLDGHELDAGDAQLDQALQARGGGVERALRREGAHVQLVEGELLERQAGEGVPPRVAPRVPHLRRPVDAPGLTARRGIGERSPVRQHELVTLADARLGDERRPPAALPPLERVVPPAEAHGERVSRGGPDGEADAPIQHLGSVGLLLHGEKIGLARKRCGERWRAANGA